MPKDAANGDSSAQWDDGKSLNISQRGRARGLGIVQLRTETLRPRTLQHVIQKQMWDVEAGYLFEQI